MHSKLNFILGVLVAIFGVTYAITEQEKAALSEAVTPILDACEKEYGITKQQVMAARDSGKLDTIDPCFIACFFKKTGVINSSGMYDLDVITEQTKKFIKGDDNKKLIASAKSCTSVNDQAVTDGNKGCERAKLLITCLTKEKANLTPFTSSA